MSWSEALILGILQGLTEFIPISSSGHLVLGESVLGLDASTLKSFDVAVHLATLLAIFVYFWKDIWNLIKAAGKFLTGKLAKTDPYGRLMSFIVIGTVPAVLFGFLAEDWIDKTFRNATSVAILMILMGLIFIFGEKIYSRKKTKKSMEEIKWHNALMIGSAQALALIPGVSRSGSTIVAGLFQGIRREEAARFSFLLAIPAILGAGLLTGLKIPETGLGVGITPLILGFLSAFISGLLAINFLMAFLKKYTLVSFAVYRVILGIGVLVFLYV